MDRRAIGSLDRFFTWTFLDTISILTLYVMHITVRSVGTRSRRCFDKLALVAEGVSFAIRLFDATGK